MDLVAKAPKIVGQCSDPEKVRSGLLNLKLSFHQTTAVEELPELPEDDSALALERLSNVRTIYVPKGFGPADWHNRHYFKSVFDEMKAALLDDHQPVAA